MSEKVEILTIDIHKGGGKYPFGMIGNCGTSGFGTPLTQEEFDDVDNLIERHRKQYEKEHGKKVKVKIIADCRANQTNLFGSPLKADIPAEIPTQLPRMIPTQIGEEDEDFEEDDGEEELEEEEEFEDEEEEPQTAKTTQEVVVCPNQNGQSKFKTGSVEAKLIVQFYPPKDSHDCWVVSVEPQNNCCGCLGSAGCFLGDSKTIKETIDWVTQMALEHNPNSEVVVEWNYNGFPLADKTDEEMSKYIIDYKARIEKMQEEEQEFANQLARKHYDSFLAELNENEIKVSSVWLKHKECPVFIHT